MTIVTKFLKNFNLRVLDQKDKRNEKLNYKIREISNEKIPYLIVIGEKEVKEKTLSVREFGKNSSLNLKYEELLKKLKNSCRID